MSRLLLAAVTLAMLVALFNVAGATAQSDAAEVRIVARKAQDGRVEFCLQLEATAARSCPDARFFPFETATVGSWLRSRTIELGQATLHIRARRNPGRRIEFAIGVELDDKSSVIQPELRFLNWDTARVDRWVRSSPVLVRVTIPLPAGGIDEDAPRLAPGERAPNFALPRLGGEGMLALSDFRGRTVAIAFWASWGSGDAELLRTLDQVWREQGANEGEFAALAVNTYDTWEGATRAYAEIAVGFDSAIDGEAVVARHYRVDGLPELYLIDARGIYRERLIGVVDAETIAAAIARTSEPLP